MTSLTGSCPILDCAEAAEFERDYFQGGSGKEWKAMQAAGKGVATEILRDARTAGIVVDKQETVLILVGKGHNGGDALIAAGALLRRTNWSMTVGFVFGQNKLRPLALKAWQELQQGPWHERVRVVALRDVESGYAIVVDGVFGFQFSSPLGEPAGAWLARANRLEIRLRAAIDLPSGLADDRAFRADATYATGILKQPLLKLSNAGRKRFIDLGFFAEGAEGTERVLTDRVLDSLRRLRETETDKRAFGLLAVLGGSRSYPGAVGITVAAALQSGVGNVMVFVPESLAPAFAARWPEAMWVGCPETEEGNLAMKSGLMIRRNLQRATALIVGPGLAREPETLALVGDVVHDAKIPVVFDADALQPELVELGSSSRIFTPHQGEFTRIASGKSPAEVSEALSGVLVLKGPVTEIHFDGHTYFGLGGGPVLARGGSGDMLAGLIGGRLAVNPQVPLLAAAQGVEWHSCAARRVAEKKGETAVRTTDLITELNTVIREDQRPWN